MGKSVDFIENENCRFFHFVDIKQCFFHHCNLLFEGSVGLIKGIFGGRKAAKKRKEMGRYLDQQDAENTAYYNSNYYSDYTQRSDAQNLMKQLRDNLSKVNKRSENMAVLIA